MKVEPLIVRYLEHNKKVAIESIGHFVFDGTLNKSSGESDSDCPFEEGSVSFTFDKNEKPDQGLIDFIVTESGKIRPLASSDLESFCMLGKQFLNIGKPMLIRGLGFLIKNQDGTYSFTQGEYLPEKTEPSLSKQKQRIADEIRGDKNSGMDFSSSKKKSQSSVKWLPIMIIVLLLSMTGAVIYYFMNKEEGLTEVDVPETVSDTPIKTNSALPIIDTTSHINSMDSNAVSKKEDTTNMPNPHEFYVIVRSYSDLQSAQKGYSRLIVLPFARKIKLITSDSIQYRIAVPVNGLLSDSSRLRDSVKILFGKSGYVETIP